MTTPRDINTALATAEVRQLLLTGTAEMIRRRAGLSLRDVGRAVGVMGSTIYQWEQGRYFPAGGRAIAYAALLRQLRETTDEAKRVRA
jgi:DNA-binding XRE family transcriptional regulator